MVKEFKNTFSWSVSRDATFHDCPRRYYFAHYGFWGGWEPSAPRRTREIYILKNLHHRPTWVGQVVHTCIAHSLKNISHGVPVLSTDEILRLTRDAMRAQFRQSRDRRYWENPKEYTGLFEHEYDIDVSDAEWREAADTVDHCLRTFYESEWYERLRATRPGDFLEIERLSSCDFDGVQMGIRLDCATREDDRVVIWDWKTGRREAKRGLSLQMACYAFYAQQRFRVPLAKVRTRRFDLFRGTMHEETINSTQMEELLSYVRGSIKDMFSLLEDAKENVAVEDRFRKVERAETCLRCNFLKVCQPDI